MTGQLAIAITFAVVSIILGLWVVSLLKRVVFREDELAQARGVMKAVQETREKIGRQHTREVLGLRLQVGELEKRVAEQMGEAKYWMARAQGEREKAEQARSFLDYGRLEREPARTINMDHYEERLDADVRKVEATISAESIATGIEKLREAYTEEGYQAPNDDELREEVLMLMNASTNGEGQIE